MIIITNAVFRQFPIIITSYNRPPVPTHPAAGHFFSLQISPSLTHIKIQQFQQRTANSIQETLEFFKLQPVKI